MLNEGSLHAFVNPKITVLVTYIVFSSTVDQSMFENSIAQQQSPQTSRAGQPSARRSAASVSHLGASCGDSPSSGGQQRLKNAINLGKAVGAKVSAKTVFEMSSFLHFNKQMWQVSHLNSVRGAVPRVSTRRPQYKHHACATAPPRGFLVSLSVAKHEIFSAFSQIIKN